MTALAFDTHAFVKRLVAAGMPEQQAEVLADQQANLIDEKLTTKDDLAKTEHALKADLAKTEQTLKADLAKAEQTLKADLAKAEQTLKADLAKAEQTLKADLREAELRLEAKIESAKSDLVKWMFGTVGFQTLVIIGAVIALARVVHP
jgi:uncharacterized membrane protein YqiK